MSWSWPNLFSNPAALALMIPIVAILMGGISEIVKRLLRHRERMAMIERGMNPDEKREEADDGTADKRR